MEIEETMEETDEISVNSAESTAAEQFKNAFLGCLGKVWHSHELVLLCIGTDRATGDSLGPLTGHKLAARAAGFTAARVAVYGTLEAPVHAQNLEENLVGIRARHPQSLIVAIDACLGRRSRIGWLTVSRGPVFPGAAARKALPGVGDISVMGTVNFSGALDVLVLQNTRLHIVMRMADIIADGIAAALGS